MQCGRTAGLAVCVLDGSLGLLPWLQGWLPEPRLAVGVWLCLLLGCQPGGTNRLWFSLHMGNVDSWSLPAPGGRWAQEEVWPRVGTEIRTLGSLARGVSKASRGLLCRSPHAHSLCCLLWAARPSLGAGSRERACLLIGVQGLGSEAPFLPMVGDFMVLTPLQNFS